MKMPHQCLKCGSVYADGSPAILRGCPQCKGMRFFYTERPISDEERDRLQEKAKTDIKHLIHEMLAGDAGPSPERKPVSGKDEWVRIDIGSGRGPVKVEGDDEVQINREKVKSIEDLLFSHKDRSKKFRVVQKPADEAQATKASSSKKAATKKSSKKQVQKKPRDQTAVITIHDEGVYDIDIEKLLEKSPLIVQKDGSYLVHLPSAFSRLSKKGRAA